MQPWQNTSYGNGNSQNAVRVGDLCVVGNTCACFLIDINDSNSFILILFKFKKSPEIIYLVLSQQITNLTCRYSIYFLGLLKALIFEYLTFRILELLAFTQCLILFFNFSVR